MRILYVASDVSLDEAHGGAVHVREVADGLAALGHAVRVVARRRGPALPGARFEVRPVLARLPFRALRLAALPAVLAEVGSFRPDVIMERYYNLGGEGMIAGRRRHVPVLLEVNSPMVEYAGSPKDRLDRMAGAPLRRWREHLARSAAALVTPTAKILPECVDPARVHETPWGANTERFRPDVPAADLGLPPGRPVVAYVGSFRAWHGAAGLVEAAARLLAGPGPWPVFLMIGDGPERPALERRIRTRGIAEDFRFVGSVPHDDVPALLRLASVGVAPFETRRHRYLEIDFYWSPLKVLETMAMGIPVVTIDVPVLRRIVRPGEEGLLVPEGDPEALAAAVRRLLDDPAAARAMGASARTRAVEEYSWSGHCARLDAILRTIAGGGHARSEA